jgi:hypothetical protein
MFSAVKAITVTVTASVKYAWRVIIVPEEQVRYINKWHCN